MTEIKPFKALCYNSKKIGDLSKVVCPPYDVISPQQQSAFYNLSNYNYVRALLPKEEDGNSKYSEAKKTFEQWLKDEILIRDEKPGMYFYKQEYKVYGERHCRLGFISLMKLQDEKDSKIFPHEKTHLSPKEDRLKLWSTLSANLSPIFVCFADKGRTVEKIFNKDVLTQQPFIDIKDTEDVRHIVWRLDQPDLIQEITASLANQQLFIADGHHRYEVAMEYRRLQLAKTSSSTGEEPFQYVLTYFTNMDSKDLKIFPMHRIVRNVSVPAEFIEEFFREDKVKSKEDLTILLAKAGQNEHAFGMYTKEGIKLLRLKNKLLIDKFVTEGSKEYQRLDATILKCFVFDKMGIKSDSITYTKDLHEAIDEVDSGRATVSFIMNPVKINQLKAIALNEERMPPKTTYFYPKVLSGLTIYPMDQ